MPRAALVPKSSARCKTMISSLEEATRLLSKWRTDSTLIRLGLLDGPPGGPNTFDVMLFGLVRELDEGWVEVSNDSDRCRLLLDVPGTKFEYVEPDNRELRLADDARAIAAKRIEGNLFVR